MKRIVVGETKIYVSPDDNNGEKGILSDGTLVELGSSISQTG
jgi:hypothetical protein